LAQLFEFRADPELHEIQKTHDEVICWQQACLFLFISNGEGAALKENDH